MFEHRDMVVAGRAILFVGGGLYPLYALIASLADPNLAAFHAAVFVIDPVTGYLLVRKQRPEWFTYAFAILTLQQIYSHGMEALMAWRTTGAIDYISLFIIVFMPSLLVLVVYDALLKKSRAS